MGFFIRLSVVLGLFFFAGFGAQGAAPGDSAGIVLESTRVIYPGSEKKGIAFTVTNRTGQTYLLQSRVVPWGSAQAPSETSGAVPFIVVPPLTRFAPDDALTLRIRLTKNDLPTDRESVLWLSLKAIPSQPAPGSSLGEGAKMVLALQNNLKLFYRPAELVTMEPEARAEALQFTRQGTQLLVHNPTPYYVTLGEIKTATEALALGEQRMLAPFSTTAFNSPVTQPTSLSWHIIDDDGRHTPNQSRSLN
ncbi:fimbrial biogenesis chaperone [Serratia fonticola]|uniref:fimbrial biogenesis chaperone n=1 Tax=Serratia fonticola TaxID=47917 RepID=UPI002DB63248|nr:molecular chaperone [Serratia fonticola]MEB7886834.1 molecular chaperone [Serratia fonticola]